MTKKERSKKKFDSAARYDFFDAVALAAAGLWLVIMVLFSWITNKFFLLQAVERALIGTIIVYAFVFISLHVIVQMAVRAERNMRKQKQEKVVIRQTQQPVDVAPGVQGEQG